MPSIETKYFGTLPYDDGMVYDFRQGLPAFEAEKRFVLLEAPGGSPLVFLQSMAQASLCFAAFPILVVDPNYQLAIAPEDLEALELNLLRQPELGADVMVLALISLHGKFVATANLMAPVVLNLKTRRGLQAIRRDSRYSYKHPIAGEAESEQTAASRPEEAC